MKRLILAREDINNPVHPNLWREICDALGVDPDSETIVLKIADAKGY